MIDVRLTYTKGLDKHYGLLELAEEAGVFKKYQQDMNLKWCKTIW